LITILITLNRFGKLRRRQVCAIFCTIIGGTIISGTIISGTIFGSPIFGSAIAGVTPLFWGGIA
jgi:hypothetical protein